MTADSDRRFGGVSRLYGKRGLLARLLDCQLDFLFNFFYHIFYSGWMDSPIGY